MANETLIKLLKTGKARVLTIVAGVVVLAGAGGYWFYQHHQAAALQSGANFNNTPNLKALPGVGNPSQEYVKSVVYQNAQNAHKAAVHGNSNVPTLTRASFLGNPEDFLGDDMRSHNCKTPRPDAAACSVAALKQARKSGVNADELKCKGCMCPSMKTAGFTAGELKKAGFDAKGLKACGFTAKQLKAAGFSAKELKDAGFSAKQLAAAGFTPGQLKAAGFSNKDIANAGYTPSELAAAGIGVKNKINDCSPKALKRAHDAGVSAVEMRQKGCGLAALAAAGYNARELRDAGFGARDLAAAGFSPKSLRNAGFSAQDLKNAGLSAGQLKDAGFNADDLAKAGFSPSDLRSAGYDADDLRKAGYLPNQLKQAGYTSGDLIRAGYSPEQAGYVAPVAQNTGAAINNLASGDMHANNSAGSIPSVMAGTMQGRLEHIQQIQQQQLAAQAQQQALTEEEGSMQQQVSALQSQWTGVAPQQYQQVIKSKVPVVGVQVSMAGAAAAKQNAAANGAVLKAGTVMFAVLDTGINSDNLNSPVMAHIVTGPLKGAKLMGQFSRSDTKVQLQFNIANIPSVTNSVGISAVAIDQNTAQTAVSGNVNNHYLLRYGSMFASAFVSGISDAMQSGGSAVYGPGFVWRTHDKLNTAQQVAAGLGNVGQEYSQNMSQNFNRAPTVKIPGGTGIGVLLMSDMQLPDSVKLNKDVVKQSQQG